MLTDLLNSVEAFLETATRPGVLGLVGQKHEKALTSDLQDYFSELKRAVEALKLEDRHWEPGQAKDIIQHALSNVMRHKQEALKAALQVNLEAAYNAAIKLDSFKEAEDEARDDRGRWTADGNGSIADKHGEVYSVKYSERLYPGNSIPKPNYDVYNNKGEHVANVELRREKLAASSSYVQPEHRRKGIASSLYKHIDRHLGYKLQPNAALTDDGAAFHAGRFKEAEDPDLSADDLNKLGDTAKAAAAWASEHADELVTGLDDTTVERLAAVIEQGITEQLGAQGTGQLIRAEVEEMSVSRALTIASTEINRAMSAATLNKLEGLEVEYKRWIEDADPCPICQANAAQGAIPLDEDFESGDDAPPAHPNCRCAVVGARGVEESVDDEARDEQGRWTVTGSSTTGTVKTTTYKNNNTGHSIEVKHEGSKVNVKHMDAKGDLLVQTNHDSVGSARAELKTQGISHKFYS